MKKQPLEIPNPESLDEKEVYAYFGLAAYYGQVFEKGLVILVVVFKTYNLSISRSEYDEIFANHYSKTIENLLKRAIQAKVPIPHEVGATLATAKRARNYLNHDFFYDRAVDFCFTAGRKKMIDELSGYVQMFHEADCLVENICRPLLEGKGVDAAAVKRIMTEMISQKRNGQAEKEHGE